MKTFKLISLQIVEDATLVDVVLEDGLIINREDDQNSWLLEAYTADHSHLAFFQKAYASKQDLFVKAIITKKDNDPATFVTRVCSVKQLGSHTSVLFEGKLKRQRNNYAETLLDHLLQKGLDGNALMVEFKEKMKTKPLLDEVKK